MFDFGLPAGNQSNIEALITRLGIGQQQPAAAVMYDRYGNYVRADRLYRAMKMRQAGCLPYSGCNPAEFQCVVGFDPVRITILSDLPLSVYCPSVTTTINRITSRSVDGTTTATVQTTTHEME